MWVLIICLGVTSFGCGSVDKIILSKEDCFAAVASANVDGVNTVAYCRPIKVGDRGPLG